MNLRDLDVPDLNDENALDVIMQMRQRRRTIEKPVREKRTPGPKTDKKVTQFDVNALSDEQIKLLASLMHGAKK